MAIPIANIQEGCCNSNLSQFTIIDGDSLDSKGSTCDIIIECTDTYILVEEKSLLFGFFDLCCKEVSEDLENYKYENNGITYLRISNIIDLIREIPIETKKMLLADNITNLMFTSAKKTSNTTHFLATKFNSNKTSNMPIFYLFCNSGKPIDAIMSHWLSRYRKNIFIECSHLKSKLLNS